jgi:hypothetical protein
MSHSHTIAETALRLTFSVCTRHTLRDEFVDAALQMEGELGIDVAMDARARGREAEEAFHAAPSVAARSRAATLV